MVVAVLCVLPACRPGATSPTPARTTASRTAFPNATEIDAYLAGLASGGHLSGAVLVARDHMVFAKAYGLADRATGAPNRTGTKFRIGSNTKQFTAMAILVLRQQGRLHLDDPICRYVSSCPAAWRPVTLQHLLTHTSGIPSYTGVTDITTYWTEPQTPAQLIARVRDLPLNFPPGSQFRYSNSGYVLLGSVIERVTGVPYGTFLDRAVLRPLGLRETGVDTARPPVPSHASGYYSDGSLPPAYDPSVAYAAGALYSTVGDLDAWDRALMARRLVSRALDQAMTSVQVTCPPLGARGGCDLATDLGYGYGWFIAAEPSGRFVHHEGYIDGFLSENGFYPDRQIDVVVLSNSEATDVTGIGLRLAAMVRS
jgi:CubicO group peptidase (beta-lactamase class C family)